MPDSFGNRDDLHSLLGMKYKLAPKGPRSRHKRRSRPKAPAISGLPTPSSASRGSSGSTDALFFYGHKSGPYDFLSQHYACTFTAPALSFLGLPSLSPSGSSSSQAAAIATADMISFYTTEQYMMYHKALLFSDADAAVQIMAASTPAAQKALGRQVRGFDEAMWRRERERIVEEGNWWKFLNGVGDDAAAAPLEGTAVAAVATATMRERLLDTGDRELVEASPRDRIWGVGFGKNNAEANRARWGLNLLGKALMKVRERLREEQGLARGDDAGVVAK